MHLAHNFVFVELPWDAEAFRTSIDDFEALAERTAWPAWFLANHDCSRVATRFDAGGQGPARARAALLLLYALRGTPFVFQGEELGLPDAEIPPDRVVNVDGRDPARAPIPWRPPPVAGPGAGFIEGEPWLPLVAGAERLCVERQDGDARSTLTLVRRLAALRRETPALQSGTQRSVDAGRDVLACCASRMASGCWPPSTSPPSLRRSACRRVSARTHVVLSTDPDRAGGELELGALRLGPGEAMLLRV